MALTEKLLFRDHSHEVDSQPQSWQIFTSIFKGMQRTYDIIFYILMIGGAFWLMNESKALDVAIYSFLKLHKKT
ncbi:MAG: hypothetical protein MZV63_40600 [Marinilabiliales bacterium]|nr:hypothetical protein [Marinilabiliales bacterium]